MPRFEIQVNYRLETETLELAGETAKLLALKFRRAFLEESADALAAIFR
jgi:hypothetical protein